MDIFAKEKKNNVNGAPFRKKFTKMIKGDDIDVLFQPVISLLNGDIFGYEVLMRGPEGEFEDPLKLLDSARCVGNLWELELLCRSKALDAFSRFDMDRKIFLNVDPDVIHSERFRSGFTRDLLSAYGILPANVVFEVTERKSVSNVESFKQVIRHYKDQGYKIAIDDAGAGYSGLNLITDIHPHFIKLDMQLVRDIEKIGLKYALVKSFGEFCKVTGIKLVAEGVETEDELHALVDIGVDYAQGYFIQKPGRLTMSVGADVEGKIREFNAKKNIAYGSNRAVVRIENICSRSMTVSSETLGTQVNEIFLEQPSLFGIPVVDEGMVQGLIMRDKFFMQLGSQYGFSLYNKRPIRLIMDKRPLVIDGATSLENASRVMTARSNDCIYDMVIITKHDHYIGTVTVKDMLNKTMEIEVNHAKHLNPLTGMPGNILIERRLEEAIQDTQPFALLYVDIDNFKAYNDVYGFEFGDRVLLCVRNILSQCTKEYRISESCFIGHIGGDDFVVMVFGNEHILEVCEAIRKGFLAQRGNFYNLEHLNAGHIATKNRHGNDEIFDFMTLSIAGLIKNTQEEVSMLDFAECVSRLKKECKIQGGNQSLIKSYYHGEAVHEEGK
jgi:diguanylate cyclase (GGDEF)-like protein